MIGVIASDRARAQHLIAELNIPHAIPLTNTTPLHGLLLDAAVFDETPPQDTLDNIAAAVPNGRIYQIQRLTPPT